jgi:hypothetical protein
MVKDLVRNRLFKVMKMAFKEWKKFTSTRTLHQRLLQKYKAKKDAYTTALVFQNWIDAYNLSTNEGQLLSECMARVERVRLRFYLQMWREWCQSRQHQRWILQNRLQKTNGKEI